MLDTGPDPMGLRVRVLPCRRPGEIYLGVSVPARQGKSRGGALTGPLLTIQSGALGPAGLGGPGERVDSALPPRGPDGFRGDAGVHAGLTAVAEGRLDEPVLAAVEADDRRPAAGAQTRRQHP